MAELYPNAVKACVRAYGYKMYEIAKAVDVPLRTLQNYCAGRVPFPRTKLLAIAAFLDVDVVELQGVSGAKSGLVQYASTQAVVSERDGDMKRRDLLQLLGLAGGALLWSDVDLERVSAALGRSAQVDAGLVEPLAAINARYWELYLGAQAKSSVLSGVLGQLRTVVQFLREPHSGQVHRDLCALVSELAQLAGEIYFDQHDHALAQSCYLFAGQAAREASHVDLWASSLIRHAFLPLYEKRYADALPLLQDAERLAGKGDSALPVRYWASAVLAEATSGVRDQAHCEAALARASNVRELRQKPPSWTRFDDSRLLALQGACYVRQVLPDRARPVLEEALAQVSQSGRRRGMVLLDLAQASMQEREVDQVCAHLNGVLTIVEEGASAFLQTGVLEVCGQLRSLAGTATAVRQVDRRVAALA